MNALQFVNDNQLKEVDAIVLRKKFMGMIDHFAIYLGMDNYGKPQFAANFTKGVEIIPEKEINKELEKYVPKRIERFNGDYHQRKLALRRAWSKVGEEAYNFFSNNCEHFKNFVHFGKNVSLQVTKAKTLTSLIGLGLLIYGTSSNKKKARNLGIALLVVALVLLIVSNRND